MNLKYLDIFEIILGTVLQKSTQTYCLMPVHTLVEVLILQLTLLLGARLSNAVGAFDPLLLESIAARRPLVGLWPTLRQDPVVQVHAQPLVQVHKWHGDANGESLEKRMDKIRRIEARHKSLNNLAICCWKNLNICMCQPN